MSPETTLKVVVEGPSDANLLRAILSKEQTGRLRFFAAQGRAALATVGRNILVHEGGPVLLVMDADTRERHLVEEVRSMAGVALSGVMPSGVLANRHWYRVFVFVPEIEVIFFEAPAALETLVGRKLPEPTISQGLLLPKDTLQKVLVDSGMTYPMLLDHLFLDRTAGVVTERLAAGKQASALKSAVAALLDPAVPV